MPLRQKLTRTQTHTRQLAFSPVAIAACDADVLLMPHCAMFVDGVPAKIKEEWTSGFKFMPKKASAMLGIPVSTSPKSHTAVMILNTLSEYAEHPGGLRSAV